MQEFRLQIINTLVEAHSTYLSHQDKDIAAVTSIHKAQNLLRKEIIDCKYPLKDLHNNLCI